MESSRPSRLRVVKCISQQQESRADRRLTAGSEENVCDQRGLTHVGVSEKKAFSTFQRGEEGKSTAGGRRLRMRGLCFAKAELNKTFRVTESLNPGRMT